jgi:hypothetical protein
MNGNNPHITKEFVKHEDIYSLSVIVNRQTKYRNNISRYSVQACLL